MGFKDKKFVKPSRDSMDEPTRHLYFAGLGEQMGTDREVLRQFLIERFGSLDESPSTSGTSAEKNEDYDDGLYMPHDRRYCVASFKDLDHAIAGFDFFQNDPDLSFLGASKVIAKFAHVAEERSKNVPEPQCTSTTSEIEIPGLYLVENFLSEEEESQLLNELGSDSAPWKESLNRRVQHYGFIFNYKTIMVDYAKPAPLFPNSCTILAERILETTSELHENSLIVDLKREDGKLPPLNQLTINEYLPGQGIASHTDTETCFGSTIYILSIGGGIVMNLTKNSGDSNMPMQNDCSKLQYQESEPDIQNDNGMLNSHKPLRKYVYLPQRSLLILSGDARYFWSHGISPRKFDKVEGNLIPRSKRVSLTFRHVVKPGPIPSSQLLSGNIEQEHVVKVYDEIAVHWNHTRGKRKVHWHRVKDFLDSLPPGTLLADIGSGDGKYFGVNPNVFTIGCDRSSKLLEVSQEANHETFCCDAVKLPFVTGVFDAVICIAVLHHMANVDRRYAVISELVRIARVGAEIMIQAWALEQASDSKHVFATQDTMVPWKLNKRFMIQEKTEENNEENEQKDMSRKTKTAAAKSQQDEIVVYERYCHVYKEGELEDLCSRVPNCRVIESGWDKGNWFVRMLKVEDDRLTGAASVHGPESKIPALVPRNLK